MSVDTFMLHVTDGLYSVSSRVPVIVGLISDETPRVTVNTGLRVFPGGWGILHVLLLSYHDHYARSGTVQTDRGLGTALYAFMLYSVTAHYLLLTG